MKVRTLQRILAQGSTYPSGDTVDLPASDAQCLIAAGAVEALEIPTVRASVPTSKPEPVRRAGKQPQAN